MQWVGTDTLYTPPGQLVCHGISKHGTHIENGMVHQTCSRAALVVEEELCWIPWLVNDDSNSSQNCLHWQRLRLTGASLWLPV